MTPEDRDFVSWLGWSLLIFAIAAMLVLSMLEKGEGQQQPKAPPVLFPKTIQLRYFPVEETSYYCVAAVTTQDAAPNIIGLPQRPTMESFEWIGCFDRKSLGITPPPSPEPTKAKVS